MSQTCTYTFNPEDKVESTVSDVWSCPHNANHKGSDKCIFHMSDETRSGLSITDKEVSDTLINILNTEPPEKRVFIGANLPSLDFEYADIEAKEQHPTDFRHAEIDELFAERARFEETIDLRNAVIGDLDLTGADLEEGIICSNSVIKNSISLVKTQLIGDEADFSDTMFSGFVDMSGAVFTHAVDLTGATFAQDVEFEGATFTGKTDDIGEITSFKNVTFKSEVSFDHASFEHSSFENAEFNKDATFEKIEASEKMVFNGATFDGKAIFREVFIDDDIGFVDCTFNHKTIFEGAVLTGGTAVLEDDIMFKDATFKGTLILNDGDYGNSNFKNITCESAIELKDATFRDDTTFEKADFNSTIDAQDATFNGDLTATSSTFKRVADFDEVIFDGDAIFTNATFKEDAIFRGAEFRGGTNHHEADAVFRHTTFLGNAKFIDSRFTSADFSDTTFEGNANFTECILSDDLLFNATSIGSSTYVNFTEATIPEGKITQPEEGWVRFDLTNATLGDVQLTTENEEDRRELLDYFRFCNTKFDGFDFSKHTGYLNRNDWNLHDFNRGNITFKFDLEMTAETIEKTYLNAKQSASAQSNQEAAGEFRVKRQLASRRKYKQIARNSSEDTETRIQNGLRAIENTFLGITCGYGLRLYRIGGTLLLFPLFSGFIFALGGKLFETGAGQIAITDLATLNGLYTLAINIYFSYITFLTVGYGNIGPKGLGARGLAAILVYMNIILAGLFLYALIKRNEV